MLSIILDGTFDVVKYLVGIAVILVVMLGASGCAGPMGAVGGPETIETWYKGQVALIRAENDNRDKGAGR